MDVAFNKHAIASHDLRFSSLISTSRSPNSAVIKPFRDIANYNFSSSFSKISFNAGNFKQKKTIKAIVNKLIMNIGSLANKKFGTGRVTAAFQKPGTGLRDWESLPIRLISKVLNINKII